VEKLADLSKEHEKTEYAFNRKEVKDHGEGGNIVGASLKGKRVLIIDDVITAGTAIREAISLLEKEGATLAGIVVALDRQERATEGRLSAIGALKKERGIPVETIITLDDIIEFAKDELSKEDAAKMEEYRKKYAPDE